MREIRNQQSLVKSALRMVRETDRSLLLQATRVSAANCSCSVSQTPCASVQKHTSSSFGGRLRRHNWAPFSSTRHPILIYENTNINATSHLSRLARPQLLATAMRVQNAVAGDLSSKICLVHGVGAATKRRPGVGQDRVDG